MDKKNIIIIVVSLGILIVVIVGIQRLKKTDKKIEKIELDLKNNEKRMMEGFKNNGHYIGQIFHLLENKGVITKEQPTTQQHTTRKKKEDDDKLKEDIKRIQEMEEESDEE